MGDEIDWDKQLDSYLVSGSRAGPPVAAAPPPTHPTHSRTASSILPSTAAAVAAVNQLIERKFGGSLSNSRRGSLTNGGTVMAAAAAAVAAAEASNDPLVGTGVVIHNSSSRARRAESSAGGAGSRSGSGRRSRNRSGSNSGNNSRSVSRHSSPGSAHRTINTSAVGPTAAALAMKDGGYRVYEDATDGGAEDGGGGGGEDDNNEREYSYSRSYSGSPRTGSDEEEDEEADGDGDGRDYQSRRGASRHRLDIITRGGGEMIDPGVVDSSFVEFKAADGSVIFLDPRQPHRAVLKHVDDSVHARAIALDTWTAGGTSHASGGAGSGDDTHTRVRRSLMAIDATIHHILESSGSQLPASMCAELRALGAKADTFATTLKRQQTDQQRVVYGLLDWTKLGWNFDTFAAHYYRAAAMRYDDVLVGWWRRSVICFSHALCLLSD